MSKKIKVLLSLVMTMCLLMPSVFCSNDADRLIEETVGYYRANKTSITTFWEVGALYGAGVDLKDGSWNFNELNLNFLPEKPYLTDYASIILANLAMEKDPRDALEDKDIVAELKAMQDGTGAFSTMINQHIWAMIALDAAKEDYNKKNAVKYLQSVKLADGGFGYDSTASDVDLTAMALVALSNCKSDKNADALIDGAIGYLKSSQLPSGGFASWGTENPNTIAAVISGLSSVGEDIFSESWQKDGKTMLDALEVFKLEDGSYTFSLDEPETDNMVTEQVLAALDDAVNKKSIWSRFNVPAPVSATVKVRIEGISSTVLNDKVTVGRVSPKVINAVKKLLNDKGIEYIAKDGYISSINGEAEKAFGGYEGWLFLVNGEPASVGIDSCNIKDNDEIVLYYGDFSNTMLTKYKIYPENPKAGNDIKITVTGDYYDWNGNKYTANVEGATVKFGSKTYKTNKDGVATIDDIDDDGTYKVTISKEQENSYPAIIRVPEFEVKVAKKESSRSGGSSHGGTPTVVIPVTAETPAPAEPPTNVDNNAEPFKDSANISDWAKDSVSKARELGIAIGNEEGCLEPQKDVTRAEFTAMLLRLLNAQLPDEAPQYSDVNENDWHSKYIAAAEKLNLVSGYDDNTFRPDSKITREEMAVIVSRAFALAEGSSSVFEDEDQISPWATDAVQKLNANGIIVGADGKFAPKDNVTREMAVVVIIRLKEAVK